jgi:hypothetical protein
MPLLPRAGAALLMLADAMSVGRSISVFLRSRKCYLFVFTQFRAQNRYAVLLELL